MCSPINLSIGVTRSVRSTGASGSGGRCGHLCVRHLVVGRQTRAALVLERETHSGRERVVHPLAGQRAHLKVGHLAVNLTPAARLTGRHLLIRFPQHETIEQSTTSDNRAWALRFYKNLYNIIQNSQDYKFQWTEQSYSHFIMLFSLPDYFEFISRSRQSTGLYSWLFFRPGVHISIYFWNIDNKYVWVRDANRPDAVCLPYRGSCREQRLASARCFASRFQFSTVAANANAEAPESSRIRWA